MPTKDKYKGSDWDAIFQSIETQEAARDFAKTGTTAASLLCVVTGILSVLSVYGRSFLNVTPFNFIDAAVFLIIAFGIHKMSRVAAVSGLIFYVVGQLQLLASIGIINIVIFLFFSLMFINAIRATFVFHKLTQS